MKTLLIMSVVFGVGLAQNGFAQTEYKTKTVYVDQFTGQKFKAKEKGTIDLGGWKHVNKLKIKVAGEVSGLQFWANGRECTPTYYPGANPYYSVEVGAAISGFEIMANEDCAFRGVALDEIEHAIRAPRGGYGGFSDGADDIAQIQRDVYALQGQIDHKVFDTYLRPILDVMPQVQIMEYARGEIAHQTISAIDAVIAQVDFASDFLNATVTIDNDRYIVIDLLKAKEDLMVRRGL